MDINNLIIEVTRRCNLACAHCLRGNAQPKDFNPEWLHDFIKLNSVSYINNLTFTGGEPSLRLNIMQECFDILKTNQIKYSGFYMATNGLKLTSDFLKFLLDLYLYADESEACLVEISNDIYHTDLSYSQKEASSALSFIKMKYDKKSTSRSSYILPEGRAKYWPQAYRFRDFYGLRLEDNIIEGHIYLNCKGEIITDCDLSYKNQFNYSIGYINDTILVDYINNITQETEVALAS